MQKKDIDKGVQNNHNSDRLEYLDGIRGIASIFVVFCHLACVFLPGLYFIEKATTGFERIWINSPLNVITNGNASVQCFFVLSGFLIARKNDKKKINFVMLPLKTYAKFLKIVAPAIIFSALLMSLGLMQHFNALDINSTLEFVKDYNNFTPSFISAVKEIFIDTFLSGSKYVGPLWTIRYEFWGTIVVSIVIYIINKLQCGRLVAYFIVSVASVFGSVYITAFVLGALSYEITIFIKSENNLLDNMKNRKIWHLINIVVFIIGIYFTSVNHKLSGVLMKPFRIVGFHNSIPILLRAIGISICLITMEQLPGIKCFFEKKPFVQIGKISAFIYIFHWPIILSLGCGLYILLQKIPEYIAILLVSVATISVTCIVSILYLKVSQAISVYIKKFHK